MTDIGTRRELLVDTHLIDRMEGDARLRLHEPVDRGVVLVHDAPWEGRTCGYHTTLPHGDGFRMYYRGWDLDPDTRQEGHPPVTCVAESDDGIHWSKPDLGLVAFRGSTANNILLESDHLTHNFVPFVDTNPGSPYAWRGVGRGHGSQARKQSLFAVHSNDGLRWEPTSDGRLPLEGKFDSQNLAFWDPNIDAYRVYYRDSLRDRRSIRTATSRDFLTWSDASFLDYGDAPDTHLYTNQVAPYDRAPHIYLGFPTRYLPDRGQITEGLFMSSRDGLHFRRWEEAFLRPGLNPAKWGNRCNYIWYGLIETESGTPGVPQELSFFTDEGYYSDASVRTRRHTVRLDGFVSVHAGARGGDVLTTPIRFAGDRLEVNVSTSAAGAFRVQLLDADSRALEGHTLDDCDIFYGDTVAHTVTWNGGSDLRPLTGRPIRLRFSLQDGDLFSYRFPPTED